MYLINDGKYSQKLEAVYKGPIKSESNICVWGGEEGRAAITKTHFTQREKSGNYHSRLTTQNLNAGRRRRHQDGGGNVGS